MYRCGKSGKVLELKDNGEIIDNIINENIKIHEKTCIKCLRIKKLENLNKL